LGSRKARRREEKLSLFLATESLRLDVFASAFGALDAR
jgi:hypothetical protein